MLELTKEEREAVRIVENLHDHHEYSDILQAAARFDELVETCGIEPMSIQHAVLLLCAKNVNCVYDLVATNNLESKCLIAKHMTGGGTKWIEVYPRGHNVLAALNRKCGAK